MTLDQCEQIPLDTVDCIDTAIGSLDAELAIVSPTIEGDPIVAFYRTSMGTPGVEVFTDAEFDRYGPRAWRHQNCSTKITLTSLKGCPDI